MLWHTGSSLGIYLFVFSPSAPLEYQCAEGRDLVGFIHQLSKAANPTPT